MSKLARELLIEQLIITCGVTRAQVLSYIKGCSFSEYRSLSEATADRNPWLTTGTNGNNTVTRDTQSDKPQTHPFQSNIDRMSSEFDDTTGSTGTGNKSKESDGDQYGRDSKGNLYQIEREFNDEYEVVDQKGKRQRISRNDFSRFDRHRDPSNYQKVKTLFSKLTNDSAFRSGAAYARKYMEDVELGRMCELAGITEVSIIGNTADSHKPTVQLRKKERIKRDQRERKRENKGYQPEKRVKRDLSTAAVSAIRRDLK